MKLFTRYIADFNADHPRRPYLNSQPGWFLTITVLLLAATLVVAWAGCSPDVEEVLRGIG